MLSDSIPQIIIMLVCIMMSAYFSATETAFSSLNKTRIKNLAEKGNKKAELTSRLADDYDKLISTILIGNNIVNILLSSMSTVLFIKLLGGDVGATVSTIVVTVVVLIFGEISPKSIAKDAPESFAMFSAPIIRVFILFLKPINFIFACWKKLLTKIFKLGKNEGISQEELLMIVDEVEQDGTIDNDDSTLIRNAIEFTDRKAEDILTHRLNLEAFDIDTPKDEVAKIFTETRFSRLLVYRETIDDVIGVVHHKDFYANSAVTEKSIAEIMTPPLFIHRGEKIKDLLTLLQQQKSHIAVVLDGYGGTLGIVTLEDVLEELVGDIWDEHDEVEEDYRQKDDNTYIFSGGTTLADFCEFYDLKAESSSVTLGGWVMEQIGQLPDKGDFFKYENLTVTVTETDGRRVSFVEVVREDAPEEDEEDQKDQKKETKSSKDKDDSGKKESKSPSKEAKKDGAQKSDK